MESAQILTISVIVTYNLLQVYVSDKGIFVITCFQLFSLLKVKLLCNLHLKFRKHSCKRESL